MEPRMIDTNTVPLWQYIQEKLAILQNEFMFNLDASEIQHMMQLTSETAVDNYAHTLIMTKL